MKGYRRIPKEKPSWLVTLVGGPAAQRRVAAATGQFVAALVLALVVQFAALPAVCREHVARHLAGLIGLSW